MPCRHKSHNDRNETPHPETDAVTDKNFRSLIISTISEFWTPRFETFSSDTRKISSEHTAMKSELNSLTTTIEVLEDHILSLAAQQDGKLNDLKSHVGQLEKLQKQAPPPPPPPPGSSKTNKASQDTTQTGSSKPTGTTPEPTGTTTKKTVTQKGKSAPSEQGHFTETKEFKNKMKKLREAAEEGSGDQNWESNIKGMGVVGKKQGKKFQIFGKQNRYTV